MRRVLTAWRVSCLSAVNVVGPRTFESRRWALSAEEEDDELVRQLIQQSDVGSTRKVTARSAPQVPLTTEAPGVQQQPKATVNSIAEEKVPTEAIVGSAGLSSQGAGVSSSSIDPLQRASVYVRIRRTTSGVLEWQCLLCSIFNHVLRTSCRSCGASSKQSQKDSQPSPSRFVATMPTAWVCTAPSCHTINTHIEQASSVMSQRERYRCKKCRSPFGGVHDWVCTLCSASNPRGVNQCCSCYTQRPVCWTCPSCKCSTNCVFSVTCSTCSFERKPTNTQNCHCPSCGASALPGWELCSVCLSPLQHLRMLLGGSTTQATQISVKRLEWSSCQRGNDVIASAESLMKCEPSANEKQESKVVTAESSDESKAAEHPLNVPTSPTATTASQPSEPKVSAIVTIRPPKEPQELKAYRTDDTSTSWKCSTCGLWCRHNAAFCDGCMTTRTIATAVGSSTPKSSDTQKETDLAGGWKCSTCSSVNTLFSRVCVQCHSVRKVPKGYWQCSTCNSVNRDSRFACLGCFGSPTRKDSVVTYIVSANAAWTCLNCTFDGNHSHLVRCSSCHFDRNVWQCHCGRKNQISHLSCSSCEGQRSISSKSQNALRWTCADCGCAVNNQALSTACSKCGGSKSAPPSPPKWLWDCEVCHNINHSHDVEFPSVVQCKRCDRQAKSADVQKSPSSWNCNSCETTNMMGRDSCTSCSAKRSVKWVCTVECPTCRKSSIPLESETCPHCNASLTAALNSMWGTVAFDSDVVKELKARNLITASDESAGQQAAAFLRYFRDDESIEGDDEGGHESQSNDDISEIDDVEDDPDAGKLIRKSPTSDHNEVTLRHSWSCALCGKSNSTSLVSCSHCSMPKDV
ncbi:zinc finger protein, putative [Bodo saltans]|uniref:Zinc finger protein, putative n=1 Tax=Bodo saltans TaxID=75058 RepID=A0A0S4JGK3_BODSA|nr:zinc finger protein, putative [Bodo saltans]|eukprot:CUG89080.1 zinc finger protein, putative [Bodo saltans]